MKTRDITQIAIYAALTAIPVSALFAGGTVNSAGTYPARPPLTATVGGCTLTSTATELPGAVDVTVATANPSSNTAKLDYTVTVRKMEFTGNPASRVIVQGDYKTSTILTQQVKQTVAPRATQIKSIRIDNVCLAASSHTGPATGRPSARPSTFIVNVSETPKAPVTIAVFAGLASTPIQKG